MGIKPKWKSFRPLDKGNYIHELLHYYYNLLKSYEIGDEQIIQLMQERMKEDLENANSPDSLSFFNECISTVIGYILYRSPIIDSHVRSDFQVESHLEYTFLDRLFHGYIDFIYFNTSLNNWVIRDHKTGARNSWNQKKVETLPQLLFYGTIFYLLFEEVPYLELSWINSDPPKSEKAKTPKWDIYRFKPKDYTLLGFWRYLVEVHKQQKTLHTLRNLTECANCPYFLICDSELKGLSADLIIKTQFTIQEEDSSENRENISRVPNYFGGRDNSN